MIELDKITEKQKLTIAKGLCDYKYIMDYWKNDDKDFRDVYYDFYLKARWAVMNKFNNKDPYFKKLQSISPTDDLMSIIDDLKDKMEEHSYELSLGSKLLHTRNPKNPIYDSKVRDYLSKEEDVDFWWNHKPKKRGAARGYTEREKIEHDWGSLNGWYNIFLTSTRGKQWIEWFDKNFPTFIDVSDIKKIDFIIYATR